MNSWKITSTRRSVGHEVAVPHAGPQKGLDAVDPVVGEGGGLDLVAAKAIPVGQHRDRRLDDGDGIAMGERDGGVGERVDQWTELLEVLRRLEHPTPGAAQERQCLQHGLQVGVVLALIERQVVVAPIGNACVPLERVGGEVDVEQLDLLLDRRREAIVHVLRERGHRRFGCVVVRAALPARVDAVGAGTFAVERVRLLALPERQRPEPGVGGQQVDEVRGARAGQADDDERTVDLDGVDLGIAAEQVGQEQPAHEQPEDPASQDQPPEVGQARIAIDRREVGAESGLESRPVRSRPGALGLGPRR